MVPVTDQVVNVIPPQAVVNNASYTANVIDTQGYRYLVLDFVLGSTDIALTALKVQESDTKTNGTTLSGGVDITGAIYGTSDNDAGSASTLPSATDDNKIFRVEIDLRGRKRYLLPTVTVGNGVTGAFVACVGRLYRGELTPTKAADKGVSQVLRVPVL